MEKNTIMITVRNQVGALARIAGLLSSRGINIENIVGAPTENPDVYRINLSIYGTKEKVEQIIKQLNKLIDTIKVVDISQKENFIVREFLLIKVSAEKNRLELFELINIFRAKVVDISRTHITIDLSGPCLKVERFIDLMKPFGIREFVRSGTVAVSEK